MFVKSPFLEILQYSQATVPFFLDLIIYIYNIYKYIYKKNIYKKTYLARTTVVLPSFRPSVCFRVVGVWCDMAMARLKRSSSGGV